MAWFIWSEPADCSWLAAVISWTSIAVRSISGTNAANWIPACFEIETPDPERSLISSAATLLRSANLRTSAATTAKPFPCSPARAASTAAFKAKILVWNAMSLIIFIFSAISFIEFTAIVVDWFPSFMLCTALVEIDSVCFELSVFCKIMDDICSMDAEISSAADAWLADPWAKDCEVLLISILAAAILSALPIISFTMFRSRMAISESAAQSSPISSRVLQLTSAIKFPWAISLAKATPFFKGPTIPRVITMAKSVATIIAMMLKMIITLRVVSAFFNITPSVIIKSFERIIINLNKLPTWFRCSKVSVL